MTTKALTPTTYYIVYWLKDGFGIRDDDCSTCEEGPCSTSWFLSEEDAEEERKRWERDYNYGTYVVVTLNTKHDPAKWGRRVR